MEADRREMFREVANMDGNSSLREELRSVRLPMTEEKIERMSRNELLDLITSVRMTIVDGGMSERRLGVREVNRNKEEIIREFERQKAEKIKREEKTRVGLLEAQKKRTEVEEKEKQRLLEAENKRLEVGKEKEEKRVLEAETKRIAEEREEERKRFLEEDKWWKEEHRREAEEYKKLREKEKRGKIRKELERAIRGKVRRESYDSLKKELLQARPEMDLAELEKMLRWNLVEAITEIRLESCSLETEVEKEDRFIEEGLALLQSEERLLEEKEKEHLEIEKKLPIWPDEYTDVKVLKYLEQMNVYWKSERNRGMDFKIAIDCVERMCKILLEKEEKKAEEGRRIEEDRRRLDVEKEKEAMRNEEDRRCLELEEKTMQSEIEKETKRLEEEKIHVELEKKKEARRNEEDRRRIELEREKEIMAQEKRAEEMLAIQKREEARDEIKKEIDRRREEKERYEEIMLKMIENQTRSTKRVGDAAERGHRETKRGALETSGRGGLQAGEFNMERTQDQTTQRNGKNWKEEKVLLENGDENYLDDKRRFTRKGIG